MAASRKEAETAFSRFLTVYRPKYPKVAECLEKDREALLAFYDFPAEHWIHIRTTNPIESTFATVQLRTAKTRGCVSRESILAMVFMLVKSAERRWLKLIHPRQSRGLIIVSPSKGPIHESPQGDCLFP